MSMKFRLVKQKCLDEFASRYNPIVYGNHVVFVKRYDGRYRIFNKSADKMLFDRNGNEVLEVEGTAFTHITADEATFETIYTNKNSRY